MCGVGLVVGKNKNIREDFAKIIEKHQKNRGPDFSKIKNYKNITISHQRLSIVGLQKKFNQPFIFKNLVLSFNGEIYNYRSLAKEYSLTNDAFFSDTACLAELIFKIGINKAIEIVDGMFSICLFDRESQLNHIL